MHSYRWKQYTVASVLLSPVAREPKWVTSHRTSETHTKKIHNPIHGFTRATPVHTYLLNQPPCEF